MSTRNPRADPARLRETSTQPAEGRRPADERREPAPTPASRRAAVESTAGALTGVYAPGELASLREDWLA